MSKRLSRRAIHFQNNTSEDIFLLPDNKLDRPVEASTAVPHYLLARRPSVIRMRDLSPTSRTRFMEEYYQSYDVMTGIRIAATLGGLISLFALFLFYKSRCKAYKEADLRSPITPSSSTPVNSGLVTDVSNVHIGSSFQDVIFHKKRPAETSLSSGSQFVYSSSGGSNRALEGASTSSSTSSSGARPKTPSLNSNYLTRTIEKDDSGSNSSQGSISEPKEIVLSKRHLRVQYRISLGRKSEDV